MSLNHQVVAVGSGSGVTVRQKTSPSKGAVKNMGLSPRLPIEPCNPQAPGNKEATIKSFRSNPVTKKVMPSHRRIMLMLSMAVVPEERAAFRARFRQARREHGNNVGNDAATDNTACNRNCGLHDKCAGDEALVGVTPIRWIGKAFESDPYQLVSPEEMFPESRTESDFMNDIYVLDVILNRIPRPSVEQKKNKSGKPHAIDYNVVRPMLAYKDADLTKEFDVFYRAVLLFLPQCGIFYCHSERRKGDAGVPGTFVAHDMAWLRMRREAKYAFGNDGYVRSFYREGNVSAPTSKTVGRQAQLLDDHAESRHYVTAWRFSTGRLQSSTRRMMFRAIQCSDACGPKLPPDVVNGFDINVVSADQRAGQYRKLLNRSPSAKKDGRHYVDGCHHYHLPASCWIIDPRETPIVDICIDIDDEEDDGVGGKGRQSLVMIRDVVQIDDEQADSLLGCITSQCSAFRKSTGMARNKTLDVGKMIAIGTHIEYNNITAVGYSANKDVPKCVLRNLSANLSVVGKWWFSQVYAGIRDAEGDSGLAPVSPMDGVSMESADDDHNDDNDYDEDGLFREQTISVAEHHINDHMDARIFDDADYDDDYDEDDDDDDDDDNDDDNDDDSDYEEHVTDASAVATVTKMMHSSTAQELCHLGGDESEHMIAIDEAIRHKMESRRRVGYTIDMSIDLGNSSHYDVHDASQGYSVWTEDKPGNGKNWYFILPNVHGTRFHPKREEPGLGVGEFHGVAVRLRDGVAISWDGRVVRHCTSVSHPDGMDEPRVGAEKDKVFENHLYGTFTAAKERVVQAGRLLAASNYVAQDRRHVMEEGGEERKRERERRRRKSREQKRKRARKKVKKKKKQADASIAVLTINVHGGKGGGAVVTVSAKATSPSSVSMETETSSQTGTYTIPRKKKSTTASLHLT